MNVKDTINLRKSIRKYKDKTISKKIIAELLDAARRAPSAKNTQSHRYFIVQDKEIKNKLLKHNVFKQPYVYEAPLIIVCCADPSQYPKSVDVDESPKNYAYIDLAIAASFLVLRATELGLGTVFVAWIYRDKIKKILNIPKNYIIPFIIPVGYPDEDPIFKPRKDLKEIMLFNKELEKPEDWLPDGNDDEKHNFSKGGEWHGLEHRLGRPRILNNVFFPEVLHWIQEKYQDNPDDFSYFEAGCGHGNDFRAMRKALGGRGRFLGVDMSAVEIKHGLEFYGEREQEDTKESRKLFAQGDLRNLASVNTWDEEKADFSQPREVKDGEFDLVYMEAVLHGLGHGKKTYEEKKAAAQQMFNELYRICKDGGKFFGRASAFDSVITKEEQLDLLRKTNNWRFIPEEKELEEMLTQAGFKNIRTKTNPHEKAEENPDKKNVLRFSFLVEK